MKQHIALGLEGIAIALCGMHSFERAARLLGAASGLREEIGTITPLDERFCNQCRSNLVNRMGEAAFQAAFEAGRQSGWEKVAEEELSR